MWQLTLSGRFGLLGEWTTFLQQKDVKAVTTDVWSMLLTFSTTVAVRGLGVEPNPAPEGCAPGMVLLRRLCLLALSRPRRPSPPPPLTPRPAGRPVRL